MRVSAAYRTLGRDGLLMPFEDPRKLVSKRANQENFERVQNINRHASVMTSRAGATPDERAHRRL